MSPQELQNFYDRLASVSRSGTEHDVRRFIDLNFPRLPVDVQNQILGAVMIDSIRAETQELKTIMAIQEEGTAAIDQGLQLREEVEKMSDADLAPYRKQIDGLPEV